MPGIFPLTEERFLYIKRPRKIAVIIAFSWDLTGLSSELLNREWILEQFEKQVIRRVWPPDASLKFDFVLVDAVRARFG